MSSRTKFSINIEEQLLEQLFLSRSSLPRRPELWETVSNSQVASC